MSLRTLALVAISIVAVCAQTFPDPSHQDEVAAVTKFLDKSRMEKNLRFFASDTHSDWTNRYYNSASGRDSQLWLLNHIQQVAAKYHDSSKISVTEFVHQRWQQNSIIVRIQGSQSSSIVIVGSHIDSTSNSPGADDDGTGTVTVIDLLEAFIAARFEPERTLEFHWYAAEEAGLLGSREVAAQYRASGAEVYGMLQVDMDGYSEAKKIRLGQQSSNENLRTFHGKVIDAYTTIEHFVGFIPGSSDHAAWHGQGYPACFGFEDPYSPYIHSSRDSLATINFDFLYEYSHAAVGFAVELSFLDRQIRPEPTDLTAYMPIGWNSSDEWQVHLKAELKA